MQIVYVCDTLQEVTICWVVTKVDQALGAAMLLVTNSNLDITE